MRHLQLLQYVDAVARAGSIRKAADQLSITSTALNRQILGFEEELGVPIFERLPRGVRLSTAGELLIRHVRDQISDMERVKSQIADLSGERRGHVGIASSQALLPFFLPEQIAKYRKEHPGVTFSVFRRDRAAAEQALIDYAADIALVFEPVRLAEVETLTVIRQPLLAVFAPGHPLQGEGPVRLRDCLRYPISLPTGQFAVRYILENAVRHTSLKLRPVVESDSFEFLRSQALAEEIVTFQIPLAMPRSSDPPGKASRPLDQRDVRPGLLYLVQLRGRALPVAASRFTEQIITALSERFEMETAARLAAV